MQCLVASSHRGDLQLLLHGKLGVHVNLSIIVFAFLGKLLLFSCHPFELVLEKFQIDIGHGTVLLRVLLLSLLRLFFYWFHPSEPLYVVNHLVFIHVKLYLFVEGRTIYEGFTLYLLVRFFYENYFRLILQL